MKILLKKQNSEPLQCRFRFGVSSARGVEEVRSYRSYPLAQTTLAEAHCILYWYDRPVPWTGSRVLWCDGRSLAVSEAPEVICVICVICGYLISF